MNSSQIKCLNLGAGKVDESRYDQYGLTVHVDQGYNQNCSFNVDQTISMLGSPKIKYSGCVNQLFCKANIFEFIDQCPYKFDVVLAERIFEHMDYTTGEIGRLLEGLNVLTGLDGRLEIVVPNAIKLSKMLLEYEKDFQGFDNITSQNYKLIINTEFCNFKGDPHGSIWTPRLAHEYIESEGTWKIDKIDESYNFAGRNIYMKIFCSKPKQTVKQEK